MKHWVLGLFVYLCAVALPALAQDDSASAAKSKIVAMEKLWNMAYKSGDAKALDGILDDAIILVNDDGTTQSKDAFLTTVKAPKSADSSHEEQVSPESMSVHMFGNTGVATGVLLVKGNHAGKPYTRRERFIDTWLNRNGHWVCIATDATPILHQ